MTLLKSLKLKNCLLILVGSAILAFGLYNIHSISDITEGGVLGLTLLLKHWFGLSPAVSGLALNTVCYFVGFKILGTSFIVYSAVAGLGFSAFYAVFELFPPLWPQLSHMTLTASVFGALFVGIGVGINVRMSAAPTGDDALAMGLSKALCVGIQWIYLLSDLIVLILSLTYIPLSRILYSLLTVILSGQIIGFIEKFKIRI